MDIRMICGDCCQMLNIRGSKPSPNFQKGECESCGQYNEDLKIIWKDEYIKALVRHNIKKK